MYNLLHNQMYDTYIYEHFPFQSTTATDHTYKKGHRMRMQSTRKVGCSAKTVIKYFDRFVNYAVNSDNKQKKHDRLTDLKHDLKSNIPPQPETRIYMCHFP
jgi:hypothetical protein